MDMPDFWSIYRSLESDNIEMFVHFRMATDGGINLEMCHPFHVHDGIYMMHNGVIDHPFDDSDMSKSDTLCFIEQVVRPNLENAIDPHKWIMSADFKANMDAHCGTGSTLVFFGKHGYNIANPERWRDTEFEVSVSNTYAYRYGNPTKLYGNTYGNNSWSDWYDDDYTYGVGTEAYSLPYKSAKTVLKPSQKSIDNAKEHGYVISDTGTWIREEDAVKDATGGWITRKAMQKRLDAAGATWDDIDDGQVCTKNGSWLAVEHAKKGSDGEFYDKFFDKETLNNMDNTNDPFETTDRLDKLSSSEIEYLIWQFQDYPQDIRNFVEDNNKDAIEIVIKHLIEDY
jgi:hypothetical protein